MSKKKRLTILFSVCFVLITGILYTIFYLRPEESDTILLKNSQSESTEMDLAPPENIEDTKEEAKMPEQAKSICVHLCGAVAQPGVYYATGEARLNEIVELAGGLAKNAATEFVNLAQYVVDGQQYYIPTTKEVAGQSRLEVSVSPVEQEVASEGKKININQASREELMTLPGIGTSKADAIIGYREGGKSFQDISDIMKVEGIKEGLFQKIQSKITV